MSTPDFTSYACSLGTVIGHEAGSYIIADSSGRVIGIPANGEPSPAAIESDIANPPVVLAAGRFTTWLDFIAHLESRVPGLEARLIAAAMQSPALMLWMLRATGQGEVFFDHPQTIAGFDALVAAQVITADERAAVFAP